ncbi:MAG: TrkA family potassium uptake protein [Chloroflexi bacterium]|nr:TrkA family potassium uptake protein [Chloroflexota bacterium]MCI0575270.1 TrkA family potassium uptake protein [Chloroflexota bacterium]MCI0645716.1 TrkA family potassium uptake protein [Chloroflexota bacterium]MCI0730121.1 TrkA family potassium uptake protein [Chloroflexota bacterium]
MFVIIVGGGKTGSYLAQLLLDVGYQVAIIEARPEVLERLQQELPPGTVVAGDGSSPAVLELAGIRQAQVLAAVTGEDEANLVITTLARFEFNVPRIIGRVNNPKNAWLFTADMGVDVALNQADILSKLIAEEMSLGDMMVLLKLRRGEYALVEEKLQPKSRLLQAPLQQLDLPETCVIAAVIRQGRVLAPRGNMMFEAGDEVLAVVSNDALPALKWLFAPAQS